MTPIVGFLVALVAGWMVPRPRRAALVVLGPWLAATGFQTRHIAAGLGVSPPATVADVGYWIVQAVILALALGIAAQLSALRAASFAGDLGRATRIASAAGFAWAGGVMAVVGFGWGRSVLDPGSVVHHSAHGHRPLVGMLFIVASVAACVVLAAARRLRRA